MEDKELMEILEKIDRKDLNKFLLMEIEFNKDFSNRFRSSFVKYFPQMTKKEYEEKIKQAIKSAGDKHGYIDYTRVNTYYHSMYDFLRESQNLFDGKNYESAFDIVEIILNTIPETDLDDSDGTTEAISKECIEIMKKILDETITSDDAITKRILDYILNEIKTEYLYDYAIELYPLLSYYVNNTKYLDDITEALNYHLNSKNHYTLFANNELKQFIREIEEKKKVAD